MEASDHGESICVLICKTGIKIFYPLLWLGALEDKSVLQTVK